ncbi:GNAT family N-acetyltransferase [Streptomyces sp. UNOC14_S4]|uniref:GNAT family N-acetyltransferase n=1 Tax=Streptomyces sp. UNOC14_S4 TaxID=2872340 RepID=UPI001E4B5ACD|nr:GNAT family N-acetyltransferase [Streptomyces sp. UNOC14_S4]MCC3773120.1 GNAT family N-acetyltransferase [Streptomyces sp. UNOC14_S4]
MTVHQSAAVVPEVRRAVPEERDAISLLIGESFQTDPVSGWVFPDEDRRRVVQPRFFGAYLDVALRDGWVDVTDDLSAAALWLPVRPEADGEEDGDLGERLSAADPGNERAGVVAELTGRVHPVDRAHYYLPVIVAAPGRQGQGRGRALLAPVMDRCDREGMPAYLEASNERSKALYERLGFAVLGDAIRLPEGPRLWPMWREPSS